MRPKAPERPNCLKMEGLRVRFDSFSIIFRLGGALLQGRCLKDALRRLRTLHWGRCLEEGALRRLQGG
jgi:hypothetical protein